MGTKEFNNKYSSPFPKFTFESSNETLLISIEVTSTKHLLSIFSNLSFAIISHLPMFKAVIVPF